MAKILYIEDTENNRILVLRFLNKRGHEVWAAEEAEEGIALAQRIQPDIILMDMGLPGVDGWEATRRLKGDPQTRHIPVLALTAHVMEGDRDKALAVGCDDYDTKPFQFPRLLAKIESLLSKHSEPKQPRLEGEGRLPDSISQIRHDLRNPLAHILGFAELLAETADEDEAREHDVAAIREQGQKMVDLINHWLQTENYSQFKGKALEVELERGGALIGGLASKWMHSQASGMGRNFAHIREAAEDLRRLARSVLPDLNGGSLKSVRQQGQESDKAKPQDNCN